MESFDQFDLVAYIAPGAIVIIGLYAAFPDTKLLKGLPGGDATLAVAFVFLSYAVGHIIVAIGHALEAWFEQGGRILRTLLRRSKGSQWPVPHITEDQTARFENLVSARLSHANPKALFSYGDQRRGTLCRQIYADVTASGHAARVDVYNRLGNFYNGLTTALVVVFVAFFIKYRHENTAVYGLVLVFAALIVGTIFRARNYRKLYISELLGQFLLLPTVGPDDLRREASAGH